MAHDDRVLILDDSDLAWRSTGPEVVVLDLKGSVYFALNAAGSRLWHMLAEGTTHEQLVNRLVEDHHIKDGRASEDVDQFLDMLRSEHFLAG